MSTNNLGREKLDGTSRPSLAAAPVEYDRQFQDQLNNALRLYFTQIDNLSATLVNTSGTRYLSAPNGAFYSTATQTAANNTTAYPITFNNTSVSNGVTVVSNSRLTVEFAGRYNIQFSAQLENTTNTGADIDIWFRKNGVTTGGGIADSNSRFGLAPRKAIGDPFHLIGTVNLFVDLQATDYVELIWCTTDVGAGIKTYAAGTSPTRPVIPSVITTVNYVSRL
jgi:hypothetical protein